MLIISHSTVAEEIDLLTKTSLVSYKQNILRNEKRSTKDK